MKIIGEECTQFYEVNGNHLKQRYYHFKFKRKCRDLFAEIQQIQVSSLNNSSDAAWLEKLETEVHAKTAKLMDLISAIKLQQALGGVRK